MPPPEESPMSENRFLDIETKLAYQEDLVASLNRIVSDQQRKLDEMEAAYRKLIDRVVEQGEELAALRIQDAPPPHY
jgi:SlyX protein